MKDFTVDDFVRFKNLEFKMEEMKKANERRLTMENVRTVEVAMADHIDDIVQLPFDEAMEMFIQEFLKNNNKKGEK